ncbi:MAG TPA: CHAT domain-containing protein [Bacteroidota bacterium]|nr:CHAT domain-containing protein [Bacteroidota bacterium]
MSSRTLLRNRILLSILAVALAAVVLSYLTDYQRKTSSARNLLASWKLVEAESALRSLVDDDPSSLEARRMFAECLYKRGELKKARDEYRALIGSDSAETLSHTLSLAFTYFFLGNLDTASSLANQMLRRTPFDSTGMARAFNLLGRIAFDKAQYDSAMLFQRRSLGLARGSNASQTEADALRQIGVLYWYHGKTDSARAVYYDSALRIYRKINDKIGEATTLNNIGLAGGSLKCYLDAFAIRKGIGDQVGLADSYYFVTGGGLNHWFDLMYSFRNKSLELSKRIGYKWGEEVAARAVEDMVVAAYDSARFDPQVVDSAVAVSGEQSIQQMLRKSSGLIRSGEIKASADLRERIVAMCDSMGYTIGLEQALGLQIGALLPLGEYKKAEAVARRLQKIWTKSPIEAGCFLARVYLASGRNEEAARLVSSLIERLDAEYLARLRQKDINFSLVSGYMLMFRHDLYSMLMAALKEKGSTEEMFPVLERFRSLPLGFGVEMGNGNAAGGDESIWHRYVRLLEEIEKGSDDVDRLLKEFDEAYHQTIHQNAEATDASQQLFGKPIPVMSDVQQTLAGDQVFVEYFVGKEKAYLFSLRHDSSLILELGQPSVSVNSSARTLRELLLRGKAAPDDVLWKGPASFLFRILIQPMVDRGFLKEGDHLIISPHGRLLEVPFASLLDSNGNLLIQRFTLSYVPSASHILSRPKETPPSTFLALVPDRASLPFAEVEVAAIPATLFSSETVLRDEQATTSELMNHAATSDVVHIAAHGNMHRWHPLFSYLQMNDGPFELHGILNLKLSSRLIVLSSCETGYGVGMMGDIAQGHEVVSFPQAFLSAGASAVIAPLWIVEDEATSRLMASFYSNLMSLKRSDGSSQTGSFSRALTLAQRQFVGESRGTHPKNHPFYWAGFYLTGNPN